LIYAQEPGPWQRVRRGARRKPALAIRLGVIVACLTVIWTEGLLYRAGLSLIPRGFQDHFLFSWNPFSPYWFNTTLLLLWAAVCWGFQWVADRATEDRWTRSTWLLADVVVLTLLLANANAFSTPLVVAYPVLVAVSGLWLKVRTVAFTTALAIAGYLTLLVPEVLAGPVPLFLHLHFVTAMVTIGLITAYQVRRIQALGRLYLPQRPPG
jgi:serine/threonine-protein kinase